jgi:hypothetical protein
LLLTLPLVLVRYGCIVGEADVFRQDVGVGEVVGRWWAWFVFGL